MFFIPENDVAKVIYDLGDIFENLRNKTILLTGGTGFIGKWLLSTLIAADNIFGLNVKIVIVSRNPVSFSNKFPEVKNIKSIDWIEGDLCLLKFENYRFDYVIHGATDVSKSASHQQVFDTSISGTRQVLDAINKCSTKVRMLYLSSGAVYGLNLAAPYRIDENFVGAPDLMDPNSAYGEGKRAGEMLCRIATSNSPHLEVVIARLFAFVGPHLPLDRHFAIGNFIKSALNDEDIVVTGDGSALRSYLYVGELVHWLLVLLFLGKDNQRYNIGGQEMISIGSLASRVNRVLRGKGAVKILRNSKIGGPSQCYVPCINKIKKDFGLYQKVSLDHAIIKTGNWAKLYG